jgi:hypothetical protein
LCSKLPACMQQLMRKWTFCTCCRQCGLRHDKYIVEKNSNECSDGNVEEECIKHVF